MLGNISANGLGRGDKHGCIVRIICYVFRSHFMYLYVTRKCLNPIKYGYDLSGKNASNTTDPDHYRFVRCSITWWRAPKWSRSSSCMVILRSGVDRACLWRSLRSHPLRLRPELDFSDGIRFRQGIVIFMLIFVLLLQLLDTTRMKSAKIIRVFNRQGKNKRISASL